MVSLHPQKGRGGSENKHIFGYQKKKKMLLCSFEEETEKGGGQNISKATSGT